MAVSFVQLQKQKAKVDHLQEQEQPTDQITLAVDRLVELDAELATIRPLQKEFDGAKKLLAGEAANDEHAAGDPVVFTGTKGTVVFSACSKSTKITDMHGLIGALKAKIGYQALLELIGINLTDVNQYLSAAELEPFISKVNGARKLASITPAEEE